MNVQIPQELTDSFKNMSDDDISAVNTLFHELQQPLIAFGQMFGAIGADRLNTMEASLSGASLLALITRKDGIAGGLVYLKQTLHENPIAWFAHTGIRRVDGVPTVETNAMSIEEAVKAGAVIDRSNPDATPEEIISEMNSVGPVVDKSKLN